MRHVQTPLGIGLLALVAACGASSGGRAEPPKAGAGTAAAPGAGGTITLAIGGPFSGSEKPTGDQLLAGAQLAVAMVNAAGGITAGPRRGAQLRLKQFDDADDPGKAATELRDAIGDSSVSGFVGSGLSDASIAAAPIASRADFPYVAAYASSPLILSAATAAKSVFVVPPTFPAYSLSVTDELLAAGHTRPALIHLTGTYGEGITKYVVERLGKAGITPVSNTSFGFDDTDFRTQLAKAKAARPDSLVLVGLVDSDAALLKQAAQVGLKLPAYDPGGITNSDTFLSDAGPLAEGLVGNSPSDAARATSAAAALRSAYEKATGQSVIPDPAAFSYESVLAVAAAFADGATGRSDLAAHLHRISLADTGLGPLSFAPDGSRLGGTLYVFTITDGKPVFSAGYEQTGPDAVKRVALQR